MERNDVLHLRSYAYPNIYPNNLDCTWTLKFGQKKYN